MSQISRRAALKSSGALLFATAVGPTLATADNDTAADWASFGGNGGNTGYNPHARVPKENVGERWRYDMLPGFPSGPAVVDGTVYFTSAQGEVFAVDLATGTRKWRTSLDEPLGDIPEDIPTPCVAFESVFVGSKNGKLYSLNAVTGNRNWTISTSSEITTPVAASNGQVYFIDDAVNAVNADSGEVIWRFDKEFFFESGLGLVDETVYVGSSGGTMYALDGSDGSVVWSTDLGGEVRAPPAVTDETVYVGTENGNFFALSRTDGAPEWTTELNQDVITSPAVSDERVFIGGEGQSDFYAFDRSSGSVEWTAFISEEEASVRASPAVADGVVFITQGDLRAIDAKTGEDLWRYPRGDFISSPPAIVDGVLLVGNWDHSLYAISSDEFAPKTPTTTETETATATETEADVSDETSTSTDQNEVGTEQTPTEEPQPTTEEPVNRGFLTNGEEGQLDALSDPYVLTIGGFALSVAGVLHSMIGGQ
ncbi:PQQ-binding-like beta-propeller repeat protein [Halobaculum rubrum]|uniref:outer membrane protein assembly factor BamB family protein n=1 Tax=Halobaculum rubrum TaxID=2872158 RepID=UPI001CA38E94|nr:PQQ-binding-like beta-propeller repeat protein [Halobaculum rubrum]QZX98854.1 PQQ-binding-like beta-propeller repeat protein [Halobaculum rubrum]